VRRHSARRRVVLHPGFLQWTPDTRAEVVGLAGKQITRGLGVVMWGLTVDGEEVGRYEGELCGSEGATLAEGEEGLVSPCKKTTRRTIAMSFEAAVIKPACVAVLVGFADLDRN